MGVNIIRLDPLEDLRGYLPTSSERSRWEKLQRALKELDRGVLDTIIVTLKLDTVSPLALAKLYKYTVGGIEDPDENSFPYIPKSLTKVGKEDLYNIFCDSLEQSIASYSALLQKGVHPHDAKYLLPVASSVTVNIRLTLTELIALLRQYLCNKEDGELHVLAMSIRDKILIPYNGAKHAFPEELFVPPCEYLHGCPLVKSCGQYANRHKKEIAE